MEDLLTEQQVGKFLGVSLRTLQKWRLERRGPRFIKMGSLVRYRPEDLSGWLDSLPRLGTAAPEANGNGRKR